MEHMGSVLIVQVRRRQIDAEVKVSMVLEQACDVARHELNHTRGNALYQAKILSNRNEQVWPHHFAVAAAPAEQGFRPDPLPGL